MQMKSLELTSLIADEYGSSMAVYLHTRLKIPVRCATGISSAQKERFFRAGRIQVAQFCGLPYVELTDEGCDAELLAAPVMTASRYADRPVYFSDVVVRSDTSYGDFADLRGTRLAYNDSRSHSGYNVLLYYLQATGEGSGFFGSAVASGGHRRSVAKVVAGEVDTAAIDSTVLEAMIAEDATLEGRLRVVETLGPSPIPPWLARRSLTESDRRAIRDLLLAVHRDGGGQAMLESGRIARFDRVTDQDYEVIREMKRKASQVTLV